MKIAYFTTARLPTEKAHGIQIVKMAEAFSTMGATVHLVGPQRVNQLLGTTNLFSYYGAQRSFTFDRLSLIDPVRTMRWGRGIYTKLLNLQFSAAILRYSRRLESRSSWQAYTRDELLLPTLSRLFPLTTWEGHNLPSRPERYRAVWQRCHRIVVLTEALRSDLIHIGIEANKILVVPDGVDLAAFNQSPSSTPDRADLGLPDDKKIILYSGHLYPWKGVDVLAQAANYLSDDSLVVFVGGVDTDVARFKKQYGDQQRIKIIGHVPPTKIPAYLHAADVLVAPNSAQNDASRLYTSPLKLFEYMASGRPIIASNIPSLREILTPDMAELVESDDPEALARAIIAVLADPARSAQRVAQAYQHVQKYSWQRRAEQIIKHIKV